MATDNTDVPVGKVIGIGLLTLGILVAVHEGIWGYYYSMYGEEQQRKVLGVPSGMLQRERADEQQRLATIDQAMHQVAASIGTAQRPPAIAPQPSTDLQALQGWQLRPRVVPNPPPAQGQLPAGADTAAANAASPAAVPGGAQAPAATGGPVAPAPSAAGTNNAPPVVPAAGAPAHPAAPNPAAAH